MEIAFLSHRPDWIGEMAAAGVIVVLGTTAGLVAGKMVRHLAQKWQERRRKARGRQAKRRGAGRGPTQTERQRWGTVETTHLSITLDHATGTMYGHVRKEGQRLDVIDALSADEIEALREKCAADPQEKDLLEMYLKVMDQSDEIAQGRRAHDKDAVPKGRTRRR